MENKYLEYSGPWKVDYSGFDFVLRGEVKSEKTQAEIKEILYAAIFFEKEDTTVVWTACMEEAKSSGTTIVILINVRDWITKSDVGIWYRLVGGQRDEPPVA